MDESTAKMGELSKYPRILVNATLRFTPSQLERKITPAEFLVR